MMFEFVGISLDYFQSHSLYYRRRCFLRGFLSSRSLSLWGRNHIVSLAALHFSTAFISSSRLAHFSADFL